MADLVELAEGLIESFLGVEFPKADLAGCYAAVDHLGQFAEQVDRLRGHVADSAADVTRANVGKSVTAFQQASSRIEQQLADLSGLARGLAGSLMDYATQVQDARRQLRQVIAQVLMTVGVTVVFGFFSAGLADAVAASRLVAALAEIVALLLRLSQASAAIAAQVAQMLTFYAVDGLGWGFADQAGQHLAAAVTGAPEADPADAVVGAGQAAVAKAADDATVTTETELMRAARAAAPLLPGPLGKILNRLPEAPETNLAARAIARMGGSSLVYTPVLNAEQGKADLAPTEAQLEQKGVAHMGGRVIVDLVTPPK